MKFFSAGLWLSFMTIGCVLNPPAVPTGLAATAVSAKQIDLSWVYGSEKVTGFKIERKTGISGSWMQIETVGANIKALQNTGLAPSTTYIFRMKAYNENGESGYSHEASATTRSAPVTSQPVYVVLFTHIEDNTPAGTLGTPVCRTNYLNLRAKLIEMAVLAGRYGARWSFEPDWKFLEAALLYEDEAIMASTGGKNILRYLRDSLGAAVDPHSHENGGYNYTDVAYLLELLGVAGSTVIGGHIWDPALPQFQEWDRFRAPVFGTRYPLATWRGDILMGSGTPNHVNDPIVSGVWRPKDRNHYWEDDPAGNIACVGAWRGDIAGILELVARYGTGQTNADCVLTASYHIKPADITSSGGLATIESSVIIPLASLRDSGEVVLTDFTALVKTWKEQFGGRACIYRVPF